MGFIEKTGFASTKTHSNMTVNATEPSNFVQENKHANTETNLVWNILDKARAYKPETKKMFVVFNRENHIIFSS